MTAPTISALPVTPSRNAPSTFSTRMDAFLAAFPTFRTEANALGNYLDDLALATGPGVFPSGIQVTGLVSGTAVQSGVHDATVGRLLRTGAFGVGLLVGEPLPTVTLNTATTTGMFSYSAGDVNAPSANSGTVLVMKLSTVTLRQDALVGNLNLRFTRHSADSGATWSTWRRIFTQGNILGTVSESAGVPTGAIIEQGSNANGNFVRFADGTQICWRVSSATLAVSTSSFGGFASSGSTSLFSATFAASPVVGATVFNASAFGVECTAKSTASTTIRWQAVTSQGSAVREAEVIAIGRWY